MPALTDLLRDYQEGMECWVNRQGDRGWAMVEQEIAWADALSRAWSPVSHLNSVADSKPLREAYNSGLERLTEHENWRQQHPGIFAAYRDMKDSESFRNLSPVQQRIIELELRDFHLAGVDLPAEEQKTYRELVMRLSQLGSRFSENVIDATQAWTLHFDSKERLDGLPGAELKLLEGIAGNHGKDGWMADLSAPCFHAVMTHANDRKLRHEIYEAYVTRASDQGPFAGQWDNMPLIEEMLSLRHKLARLLGFDNYVEFALARRMADSPASVVDFLESLASRARSAARQQYDSLLVFASEHGATLPLEAWDIAYWSERFRQAELHLSDEELKPYFSLERMLSALLFTARQLFGIEASLDENIPTWHRDVRFYWLHDRSGRRIAGMYLDLFARRDKRGGAWMFAFPAERRTKNCSFQQRT